MSISFPEKSPMATVLLVSELKTSLYQLVRTRTLVASLPNKHYLVSVQPTIPPCYYHIPCIASAWKQEREQAKQALLSFGTELDISPENCLLLSQSGLFFKKARLKQQLERQLKCSIRLLSLTDNEPWVTMPVAASATMAKRPLVQSPRTQSPVKIRALARSSVLS